MRALGRELFDAARRAVRRPRGVVFPVAILSVAIALAATIFSVVQGVWLRGLPVRGGDRFLFVSIEEGRFFGTLLRDVEALRAATREGDSAFEGVVTSVALNFMLTGEGRGTVSRTGTYVSPDLFQVLGIEPFLGRVIEPSDADPSAPPVSVLGYAFWQSYLGGDEAVLGQRLVINRVPTTIVGVAPPGFGFPYRQELWTLHRQADMAWSADTAAVFARLAPGASLEQARGELELLAARLDASDPLDRPRVATVKPFVEELVDPATRRALGILVVAVLGVLVVACANAANLQLADSLARRQELAVRSALGARRARLVLLLFADTAVVLSASVVVGLALAWLLVEQASQVLLQGSLLRGYWMDVRLDGTVVAGTVAVAALAVLVVGLVPAWLASGRRGGGELRSGARVQRATSRGFVALQVGLCFALVVAAGALSRNALELLRVEPGFGAEHLQGAQVSLFQKGELPPEEAERILGELVRRVEARPEIERVALGRGAPWSWAPPTEFWLRESDREAEEPELESWPTVPALPVDAGYLETARIPIVAGRSIEGPEVDAGVAVASVSFARRWLGGVGEAVGRRLTLREGDARWTVSVIGVAADLGLARLQEDPTADERLYLGRRFDHASAVVLVRSRSDAPAALAALEEEATAVDPLAATYNETTFAQSRAASTWEQRLLAKLLVVFGVTTLLLAAAGLYSVVELSGRRRRREFGLRMALGAIPGQVCRLLVREGALQLAYGLVFGLVVLTLISPAIRQFLVRSSLWDPLVVGGALVAMVVTVLVATFGPARRAARLDPSETLRRE